MDLFIYFALPLATVLLAIVLQRVLKCPILVAITFFSVYLIISFIVFSDDLAIAIIATIIYSILAYITAYIVKVIVGFRKRLTGSKENINDIIIASDDNENKILDSNVMTNQCNCENLKDENMRGIINDGYTSVINANRRRGCYRRM